MELDAADRRDHALSERHFDHLLLPGWQPRHAAEHRREDDVAVAQARRRIAGHPEDRLSVHTSEDRRLAGLYGNPVEEHVAHRPDDVDK